MLVSWSIQVRCSFKFMDGGFVRKGTSVTRISIYFSKDRVVLSTEKVVQCCQPSRRLLVILGKCAQCWSLLLGDLTLSSSCSQVSLGEQQFMLLSSCINSISVSMTICSQAHWAMTVTAWKEGASLSIRWLLSWSQKFSVAWEFAT